MFGIDIMCLHTVNPYELAVTIETTMNRPFEIVLLYYIPIIPRSVILAMRQFV